MAEKINITERQFQFILGVHRIAAELGRPPTAQELVDGGVCARVSAVSNLASRLRECGAMCDGGGKSGAYRTKWMDEVVRPQVAKAVTSATKRFKREVNVSK